MQGQRDGLTYDEYDESLQGWFPSEAVLARSAADRFATSLPMRDPPERLSASELHSRIILLEDYAKACRAELQRRPSHCREALPPQPTAASSSSSPSCCLLLQLSPDEMGKVVHELCDPLRPKHAVHLSSTAKGLRVLMQAALRWLYWQRMAANALAAHLGERRAPELGMGNGLVRRFGGGVSLSELELGSGYNKPLTLDLWKTLGTLVGCGSFPHLTRLAIKRVLAQTRGCRAFSSGRGCTRSMAACTCTTMPYELATPRSWLCWLQASVAAACPHSCTSRSPRHR